MKSVELREMDKQYWAHWQAFLNLSVKAEKGRGRQARPKYDTFKKFFDREKEINRILKKETKKEPETISRLRDFITKNKEVGGKING